MTDTFKKHCGCGAIIGRRESCHACTAKRADLARGKMRADLFAAIASGDFYQYARKPIAELASVASAVEIGDAMKARHKLANTAVQALLGYCERVNDAGRRIARQVAPVGYRDLGIRHIAVSVDDYVLGSIEPVAKHLKLGCAAIQRTALAKHRTVENCLPSSATFLAIEYQTDLEVYASFTMPMGSTWDQPDGALRIVGNMLDEAMAAVAHHRLKHAHA